MLKLENICYEKDNKKILNNINIEIDDNIYVITGPNGAGKSTLGKIIMGIINPTSGKIIYNGKDITNLSLQERAREGFSYAFQQPVRFKGLKVVDMLRIANKSKNIAPAVYLQQVGLCAREYLQRELDGSLSGGELKRIEIATVLAKDGILNIFDEPEAGIDLWSFNHLIDTFTKFMQSKEKALVIISHQQKIIELADKVILLNNGKLEACDSYENIKDNLNQSILKCNQCEVSDE